MARKTTVPKAAAAKRAAPPTIPTVPRVVGSSGRITRDDNNSRFFGPMAVVPPPDPGGNWRALGLDARTLDTISVGRLAEYLVDLSPEVSKALFDFLRETNPGYELVAYGPGGEVDTRAQAALDAFVAQLDDRPGCLFDVTIGRLFMGMFLRGAFLAELVLDETGRLPVDLVTPDPWQVRFRRQLDPVLGIQNVLCQWQDGRLVDLDGPTIRYVPVDPLPSTPYGRPLVAPALFVSLFMLAVMHDLRRVIQQQGYPRHDIEINLTELIDKLPEAASDPSALFALADQVRAQVETHIASLQPDDTLVHTSMVKVNQPVGAVNTANMGGIAQVIDWLERAAVRSLKSAPFMMAMSQSQTETQANRQYESHILGIQSLQHYAETPLSRLFTLALQAQGIVATVEMRFSVNRASERERDARTEQIEIANARARYDHGWIGQDAAALAGAGVDLADVPEPRVAAGGTPSGSAPAPAAADPAMMAPADPGANRVVPTNGHASVDDLLATI